MQPSPALTSGSLSASKPSGRSFTSRTTQICFNSISCCLFCAGGDVEAFNCVTWNHRKRPFGRSIDLSSLIHSPSCSLTIQICVITQNRIRLRICRLRSRRWEFVLEICVGRHLSCHTLSAVKAPPAASALPYVTSNPLMNSQCILQQ